MISLNSFIDFNEYNNFSFIHQNNYTSIATANKKLSPYKKLLFKIFKFPCVASKDQKIILETFCHISKKKIQYLINYKKISFSYQSKYYPSILMKYVSSKTLEQVLSKNIQNQTFLTETSIFNCLFAVSEAIFFLHNHIIVHGNLCPSNIILDELNQVYVSDFGLYPIKKLYIAPNDLFNKDYKDPFMVNNEPSFKNDVYSFGILICHLFLVFNQTKNSNENHQETLEEFINNPNPNKYSKFPKFLKEMILSCLNEDMSKRPTFKQIIEIFKTVKSELYSKFSKTNYVKKLAKKNNPQALNQIGKMYQDSSINDKDENVNQKAQKYYKKASSFNYSEAQSNYGIMLQEKGSKNNPTLKEGAKIIQKSAMQGNLHGLYNYGMVLINAQGVEKDTKTGMYYLKKAADHGFEDAQVSYAYLLLNEDNQSPEKIMEGLDYFKKAMSQNSAEAFCSYAFILKEGKNIEKNEKIAMEYFKIAADNNIRDAMVEYAYGNLNGIGVPKNDSVALKYFQLAAANGDEEAEQMVSELKNNKSGKTTPKRSSSKTKRSSISKSSSATTKTTTTHNERENSSSPKLIKNTSIETNNIQKKQKFKFPIQISPNVRLISLGNVVYDKRNYHTDKYIYPVGYEIEREYCSIKNPNQKALYRASILNGGNSPIFRVQCLDKTNQIFEGNNPSKPWVDAFHAVEESKRKLGMPTKETIRLSGHRFFGFTSYKIIYLIEQLPNVDKCTKYKFQKYYVRGIDEPIDGGHEIRFMNENDLFEEDNENDEEANGEKSEDDESDLSDIINESNVNEPACLINDPISSDSEDIINEPVKTNNAQKKQKFKFPIQISPKVKLISLGNVVYDKRNYHTDEYIYPVGYEIEREYNSIKNPNEQVIYRATILDGGDSPIFRVQCLDETNKIFEGSNPSKPWINAFLTVEASKRKLGMPTKEIIRISGYRYFGLTCFTVKYLIERLPNVDKCSKYVFKKFYIRGTDEPIEGGHEVEFMDENGVYEDNENIHEHSHKEEKDIEESDDEEKNNDESENEKDENNDEEKDNDGIENEIEKEDNDDDEKDNDVKEKDENDDHVDEDESDSMDILNDPITDVSSDILNESTDYAHENLINEQNDHEEVETNDGPNENEITDKINDQKSDESTDIITDPITDDSTDIINEPILEGHANSFHQSQYEEVSSLFDESEFSQSIDLSQPTENLIKLGDSLSQHDPSNALKCYQEAANRGDANAYLKCAKMCSSFETKLEYCEMAMKNNIPGSFVQWRKSILKHLSLSQNKDLFFNSAQRFEKYNDFSDAAFVYYQSKDILNFQICYEKAKKNIDNIKDGYQQYYFGKLAQKQNEFELAKILFEKALENNVKKAEKKIIEINQASLPHSPPPRIQSDVDRLVDDALDYYEGRNGKEIIPEVALVMFTQASNRGSPIADYYLGKHYQNEIGAKYLKKSADAGNSDAQNLYAHYLDNGIGVEKNHQQAMIYHKMSADQGNAEASCIYGHELFTRGITEEDKQKGILYLKKSAEKLFPDAIYFYSKIISDTNPFDSLKFYNYSIEKGSKLAIKEEEYRRNLINML